MKIHEFDPVIYPCKLWVTKSLTDELNETFEMFPDGEPIPIEFAGAMTFSVRNKVTHDLGFLVAFKSAWGESAPKARQKCVVDGKQVNIPALLVTAMGGRRRLGQHGVGCPCLRW